VIAGIRLKVIWFDEVEDLLEILFSCSNRFFSGQAKMYVSTARLSKFADAIGGFPFNPDDIRDFDLGTFESGHAGGVRLHFHCEDIAGHAVVDAKLRDAECKELGEVQSVALRIPIQAAGVDEFVKQLRQIQKTLGSSADLPKAGS
jgi:hypothetical protein